MMIRLSARIRRLASVSTGIVLLSGCAAHRVEDPFAVAGGLFAARPGRVGFVVAAPCGPDDVNSGHLAAEIARRTGFGLVVASELSLPAGGSPRAGCHSQVNRPLEGLPERPPSAQGSTGTVSDRYEQRVLEAAQGPLRFYAEIRGSNRTACAGQLSIATVGVDHELALRLRALAALIQDAHVRANGEMSKLDVVIEPVDPVTARPSGAGVEGVLRRAERGLQIQLPQCARRDWRDAYTAILSDFLAQAVMLTADR
jgi:hypothetical protein